MMKNSPIFLGSNINLVKAHNLEALLLNVLHNEPVSRVQLARNLSLSATTISNLVDELLELGVIEENPTAIPKKQGAGRPQAGLRLVNSARYAVGVHIGVGTFQIAITNLKAELLAYQRYPFRLEDPPDVVLGNVVQRIDQLLQTAQIDRERLVGIGVGTPGLVNYQTGVTIMAANLGWRYVPIQKIINEGTGLPVILDNNVRAMSLGEAFFGAGRQVNSLAFIYGRTGVGAGIVVGNRIFRGNVLGAGEIGHTIILPHGGELCRCGKRGCLETLVSEPALLQQAYRLAQEHPDSLLAQRLALANDVAPSEHLFEAARAGDPFANDLVKQTATYLGIALANLVNLINPELILLGGIFYQGQDLFLPEAHKVMQETAFTTLGEKVRLEATSFGHQAGVIGAATLALTTFFYLREEGNNGK